MSISPAVLETRISADVHALLKRAADLEGRTIDDFVVTAAQEAARRTIEENDIIRLALEDQHLFADRMLNPREPAPALQRAFQHRTSLFGVE